MNIIAISFLIILIFDVIKGEYVLEKFQQNLYNEDQKYFRWIFNNKRIVFLSLDFFSFLCFILAGSVKGRMVVPMVLLSWVFYFFEICRILSLKKMEVSKKSLILSKRVKRLIGLLSLFYISPLIVYLTNYEYGYLSLVLESAFACFLYYIVWIVKIINMPIEKAINNYNYQIANSKRNRMSYLEVVGITGTYGKSSTSQIVNTVLNENGSCQSTPKNLNTLHGLVTTINNYLGENERYFIVEMGAYKMGEVESICELAKPQYAIITNIETTKLDPFGSMENAVKTKFELVEALPADGIAILNKDDRWQVAYPIKSMCKKIWISLEEKADYTAQNIKYSKDGTRFTIYERKTGENYKIETRLLGKHNVYHILSAVALARELGMDLEKINRALAKVRPLENHLELRNFGYMHQINNTHRSNPQGAKNALDVLSLMPGEKVVVTTGMQTLGEKSNDFNNIFGSQVAKVANYVILINEKSTKPIFKGLMESGFDQKKVYIVNRIQDAYTLLQEIKTRKEIYALFESDEDLKD